MIAYIKANVIAVNQRAYPDSLPQNPVLDKNTGYPMPALVVQQTGGLNFQGVPIVEPLYTMTAYGRNRQECMSVYQSFWRSSRNLSGGGLPPRRINNRWVLYTIAIASEPSTDIEETTGWPVAQFAVSARWDSVQGA